MIKKILKHIEHYRTHRSSDAFIAYLRSLGVTIGERCIFRDVKGCRIDITSPKLITIGNDVDMNRNFQILTHDNSNWVFRNIYKDYVTTREAVTIGNNIYFGTDVTVLKGVTIGDNCIIGAGSIVTKDVPSNSVAAGTPCKVISSLEEYYQKQKNNYLDKAVEYVNILRHRLKRNPTIFELAGEFPLFVDKTTIQNYPPIYLFNNKRVKTAQLQSVA